MARESRRRLAAALFGVAACGATSLAAPLAAQSGCTLATQPGWPGPGIYGVSHEWLQQMRIPQVHALGFTGKGVRIAILDTGFDPEHESLSPLRVLASRDFIHDDDVVSNQPGDSIAPIDPEDHGTQVWSLAAGCSPGQLVGPAFDAEFLLAKVDAANPAVDTREDEARWIEGALWADSLTADLLLSAVGFKFFQDGTVYDFFSMTGDSLPSTRVADRVARRGVLVVQSVGNHGPELGTLVAPADADSVLAVGAVDAQGVVAPFSSRGPTTDLRIKPELVARGTSLIAADAAGPGTYEAVTGTSFAAPLVAGAAALVMEAWPELSKMAVRRALILSGSRTHNPDNAHGYGIPDVLSAISFPEGLQTFRVTGAEADGRLTTLTPTFRWQVPLTHPSARPVRYFLELATDTTFVNVIYRDSLSDALAVPLKRALRPTPRVFWRVIAVAANSATRVSSIGGPLSVPDWIRLESLNSTSGNFVGTSRPTFVFHALPAPPPVGPLTFEVQVITPDTREVVRSVTTQDTVATLTEPLAFNVPYRWRVIGRSPGGVADTTESVAPFVVVSQEAPPATLLYQNFPNPFPVPGQQDGGTQLWFDLAERVQVQLAVYDLRGRLVRRLIPLPGCGAVELAPGLYGRERSGEENECVLTHWDGRDDEGRRVASGVYLIRLRAGGVERVVRALFLPE